jgi:hypothetical protein
MLLLSLGRLKSVQTVYCVALTGKKTCALSEKNCVATLIKKGLSHEIYLTEKLFEWFKNLKQLFMCALMIFKFKKVL